MARPRKSQGFISFSPLHAVVFIAAEIYPMKIGVLR
jgi:hypothetical protein